MYVPSSLEADENRKTEYGESQELVGGALGTHTRSENSEGWREAGSPHISMALGGRVSAEAKGLLSPTKRHLPTEGAGRINHWEGPKQPRLPCPDKGSRQRLDAASRNSKYRWHGSQPQTEPTWVMSSPTLDLSKPQAPEG